MMCAPLRLAWAGPADEGKELEEAAEAEAEEQQDEGAPDPITQALIDDAVVHFKDGQRMYQDREYTDAADAFRRSYESIPSGMALYNESLAAEKAGKPARALKALDRYLALPDCTRRDELLCALERESASRASEKLRSQVGELDIVLEPGATVRGVEIDGELYGLTAFPVYAEPGVLEVVVVGTKEGQRKRVAVDMVANKRSALVVPPFGDGSRVAQPPSKTTEERTDNGSSRSRVDPELRRNRLRYAFYGSLGATIASGAALAVVGGVMLDTRRDYNRRCTGTCGMLNEDGTVDPGPDRYDPELKRRFDRLQPVSTALVIVTSALALTTITLAIFAFVNPDRTSQRASTRAPKPGAQFTGNGVRVRW
jgi:hypothetical protein